MHAVRKIKEGSFSSKHFASIAIFANEATLTCSVKYIRQMLANVLNSACEDLYFLNKVATLKRATQLCFCFLICLF